MITIDQARIDAPDFPRSQEWWRRFVPAWADVTVNGDGTVTLQANDVAWWEAPDSPRLPAPARRRREQSLARWVSGIRRLAVAIVKGEAS